MGIISRTEHDGGIVVLTLDDGKRNALDVDVFREIDGELSSAAEAEAIVLAGREGTFSAGLNTKLLEDLDDEGLSELLVTFGRTIMSLWLEPRPVVAACTGHAVAAGTMLAMACDHAVAARGDHRWGLTETRIGFPMPEFAAELARGNVRRDRLDDLLLRGAIVDPEEAVAVGFADELAEPDEVLEVALTRARELAELPRRTYGATKLRLRGLSAQRVLDRLTEDVDSLVSTARSAS